MPQKMRTGICTSCARRVACKYVNGSATAILNCDEYENRPERAPDTRGGIPLRNRSLPRPATEVPSNEKTLGLCRTCDALQTCCFSRPEGGVWRCEEYQ